ncbi:phosphate/phosphite/phosphonate ABC transporter substrate-binding protein [Enterovibrio sp. ZSDZ35]|uniref:Phosphate/phosphite/phosphonate ABC transporter substrate-binding protein n=1 Tax=Enterovibrio qingdaonensis TaxID=2899818 RepID=A0ABT5QTS7_9GAMM|nr:phosphate/phosphite/phosphonate ABC transporter substrate-binding protein [Enterovibrio sp. ZSDZ35]MDD1784382.1 phosphate/phosphite/phosphonate ABC transporter substrate-binding protein [Enterovibrio sp. ZSDZ35]
MTSARSPRTKTTFSSSLLLTVIAFVFSFTSPVSLASSSKPLVFGVVPQQSSAKLIRDWSPVIRKITKMTGIQIRFATAPNIPEFERRLAQGMYDIAYMNPYHFTVFNESPGYQAVAHAKDKKIKGILVVSKNSEIEGLNDLHGQNVAFPAPAAFAATLLTQATLKNQGVEFTPHYVGSHDSSYISVSDGLFSAGGGIVRTLGAAPSETKENLRVLHTTKGYTPHAVATHPSVSDDDRARIQNAFIALSQNDEGKETLKALNITGFQAASNSDWDDVRALNISVIKPK